MIGVLYPQYWDKKSQTIFDGVRQDAHKLMSKNLKKARQLVNSEYQTLVPLDVARAEEVRERGKKQRFAEGSLTNADYW